MNANEPTREEAKEVVTIAGRMAGFLSGRMDPLLRMAFFTGDDQSLIGFGIGGVALLKAAMVSPEWAAALVAKVEALEQWPMPEGSEGWTLEETARQIIQSMPVSMVIEPR